MSSGLVLTKRIHQLHPGARNFLIVGVIIVKGDVKYLASKNSGRALMTLTIRDSERDTINCKIWASRSAIDSYERQLHIGDVVHIKPSLHPSGYDPYEHLLPRSTSPFILYVEELDGDQIRLHEGPGLEHMRQLVHVAPITAGETVPLASIVAGGRAMIGKSVSVLVVIRTVRPKEDFIKVVTGKPLCLREVIVMDAGLTEMSMKLWGNEYIERADRWIPMTTVLLVTEANINQRFNSIFLEVSSKTIITEDPIIEEADRLMVKTALVPLRDPDASFPTVFERDNPRSITSVMSVQQILDRAEGKLQNENEPHFTALCYAVITKFDLDGCYQVVRRRCLDCRSYLPDIADRCSQRKCAPKPVNLDTYFNIPLAITDHTGTLPYCWVSFQAADSMLGCNVHNFLKMSDQQKGILKWKFLLERCAVRLSIKRKSPTRTRALYNVAECVFASPQEVDAKIKLY